MALISTALFFGSGLMLSQKYSKPKHLFFGISGSMSLFYLGSLMEFDRLVTLRPIPKTRPGYWLIGGGVCCVGLSTGIIAQSFIKHKHKNLKYKFTQINK
ncbi:hypothetical protein TCON_0025 [Astathelohania contejeani]|uniref:Uncharacterized protein n=1 Tax=Astathelohania contejeani TaxID=164912 RepID=A0ABQ7I2W6_9MICR|nr:hypothetical protein TCON_0025 [Thelohania contejeani]